MYDGEGGQNLYLCNYRDYSKYTRMIKIKNTNKKLKKKTWFTFTSQQISDAESTEEFLVFKAQSKKKKQRG